MTPVKDDNAVMRDLYPRTFARNFDDCYKLFYKCSFLLQIRISRRVMKYLNE